MRRVKSILAAATAMAVMMVAAAPAMADEHWRWGFDDPNANSDDIELLTYWWGAPYLVEYESERVDGEWTWVVDDVDEFEPAWDEGDELDWANNGWDW